MQVGRIHIQRQCSDDIAAVGKGLNHIIHASFREQGILIRERQGVVADGCLIRMALERTHDKVEVDDAVATLICIKMNGALAALVKDYRIVEDIRQGAFANLHRHRDCIDRIDGKVQCHHAVAVVGRGERHRIITGFIVNATVEAEHVAIANLLVHIMVIGRVHRQHQLEHAVAMVHRLQAVPNRVRASLGRDSHIGMTVPDIRHIVARRGRHLAVICRIHRQGQHIDTVAVVHRLQRIIIDAGSLNRATAPLIRQFVAANNIRHRNQIGGVHRQVQLIDAVAVVHRLQAIPKGIAALRGRDRHVGMAFPNVRHIVARGGRLFVEISRVHRQMQVHEAVAAVHRGQHDRINTRCGIIYIIICINITLANRRIHIVIVGRIHRQGQHAHTVAALRGLQTAHYRMRAHRRRQRVEIVQLIRIAQADGIDETELVHRFHRQGQEHGAVAAEARVHMALMRERAGHVCRHIGKVVIVIGNILTNLIGQIGGIQRMNRQIQDHDTVTLVGSNEILCVESRGIRLESVLRISFILADVGMDGIAVFGSHRQRQRDDAVATVHCGKRVHIRAGHVQNLSVEIVGGRLANRGADILAVNRVDRQLQRGGAVATIHIDVVMNEVVNTRHVNGGIITVSLIMGFGAHHILIGHITAVEDGEMQRHRAVATMNRAEMLLVVARGIVGFVIPSIGIASLLGERIRQRRMNRQVQCHHAVAAVNRIEMLHIIARSRIGLVVPCIEIASVDGKFIRLKIIHYKGKCHNTVTAVGGGELLRIGAGCGIGLAIPYILVAHLSFYRLVFLVFHHEGQRHKAVAAIGRNGIDNPLEGARRAEGLRNAVTDIFAILADGVADDAWRIHRIDSEDLLFGRALAGDVVIRHSVAHLNRRGSVNHRHLIAGADVLHRLVGDDVGVMPCVITGSRGGDDKGHRAAIGHRGKRRHRRHRTYRGRHLRTLAPTTRLGVVALHKIGGGGIRHAGIVCQARGLRHRAVAGEEPLTAVGVLVNGGVERHRAGTAAHLVRHRRHGRIGVHCGRHRHTLALTTGIRIIIGNIDGGGGRNRDRQTVAMLERLRCIGRLIPVVLVAIRTTLCTQCHLAGGTTGSTGHRSHRRLLVRNHREGDHAVTTHRIGNRDGVCAGSVDCHAMILHRIGVGTNVQPVGACSGFLHRQVDGHHTVAIVGGSKGTSDHLRCRELFIVPDKTVTHHCIHGGMLAAVDGQMQGHDAVTTIFSIERTLKLTAVRISQTIPCIGVTSRFIDMNIGIRRIYRCCDGCPTRLTTRSRCHKTHIEGRFTCIQIGECQIIGVSQDVGRLIVGIPAGFHVGTGVHRECKHLTLANRSRGDTRSLRSRVDSQNHSDFPSATMLIEGFCMERCSGGQRRSGDGCSLIICVAVPPLATDSAGIHLCRQGDGVTVTDSTTHRSYNGNCRERIDGNLHGGDCTAATRLLVHISRIVGCIVSHRHVCVRQLAVPLCIGIPFHNAAGGRRGGQRRLQRAAFRRVAQHRSVGVLVHREGK